MQHAAQAPRQQRKKWRSGRLPCARKRWGQQRLCAGLWRHTGLQQGQQVTVPQPSHPLAQGRSLPARRVAAQAAASRAERCLAAAAERLDRALLHLEAALGGAPLDPAAASTLQRCTARLAQLLAVPEVV